MEVVVLQMGPKKTLRIKKDTLCEEFEGSFRTSLTRWLKLKREDWDECCVNVASSTNSTDCFVTEINMLYSHVQSWLAGKSVPPNDIKSPMSVSVDKTRHSPAVANRHSRRSGTTGTGSCLTGESDWKDVQGRCIHVTSAMQLALREAGRTFCSSYQWVVHFLALPDGAYVLHSHCGHLSKLAAEV